MVKWFILVFLVVDVSILLSGCGGLPWHSPTNPVAEPNTPPTVVKEFHIPIGWLVTLGLFAISASVALVGLAPSFQKIGIAGLLGGGTLVAGSLAVAKYSSILALTSVVIFGIIVVWSVMKHVKVTKEVVKTVEVMREKLTPEQDATLFGNTSEIKFGDIRTHVQSDETREAVKKIKGTL